MTRKIENQIHPNDEMYHGSLEHYIKCGKEIADMIDLSGYPLDEHSAILELPCGYGRGTRHIAARFTAQLHVADIQSEAVDFLVSSFKCKGYVVTEPIMEFKNIPDEYFDIAIMGSLITHLNFHDTQMVVTNFANKLKPGGVAIISTLGERSYEALKAKPIYDIYDEDRARLLKEYELGMYGFCQYKTDNVFEKNTKLYAGEKRYGISLCPRVVSESIFKDAGLSLLKYEKGIWDGHLDVFWLRKK